MENEQQTRFTGNTGLEEFTQSTFSAVMRALDARSEAQRRRFPSGPIVIGFIGWPDWPEGIPGEIMRPPIGASRELKEPPMGELSLSDRYRATQALGALQRLLLLDDIWTQYLKDTTSVPRNDKHVLQSLTDEMRALLTNSTKEAEWLQSLLARHPQWFERAWADALSQAPLPERMRYEVQARLAQRGGFVAVAQASAKGLLDRAAVESWEIATKMQKISSGSYSSGDLSREGGCFLLGAVGALALVTGEVVFAVYIGVELVRECD
jgi:hypothetical protein